MDGNKSIGNIRHVLDQVKSGKIDKSVAYSELKDILHQAVNKRSKDVQETDAYLQDAHNDVGDDNITIDSKSDTGSITRFTKEERQLIINKLIEKKRLDRNKGGKGSVHDNHHHDDMMADDYHQAHRNDQDDDDKLSSVEGSDNHPQFDDELDPSSHYEQYVSSNNNSYISQKSSLSSSNNNIKNKNKNHQNHHKHNNHHDNVSNSYYDDYQHHNQSSSLGRSNRILRSEAAIREDMFKDCTFHPDIKPLPDQYGQPAYLSTPFLQRVSKWQKEKNHEKQKMKKDYDLVKVQDCSFHPVINRHSYKAMQELRQDHEETVTERLYKEAKTAVEYKNKFLEDEYRLQEEINRQTCTFRPNLQTRGSYHHIGPKYMMTPNKNNNLSSSSASSSASSKECTFTPKIKGVRPHMNSAKLYVSEKVVDRLTRPSSAHHTPSSSSSASGMKLRRSMDDSMVSSSHHHSNNDHRVMDVASFMNATTNDMIPSASASSPSQRRSRSSTPQRSSSSSRIRSHSAPRERVNNNDDSIINNNKSTSGRESINSMERKAQFESFLLRQKFSIDQKTKKITEKTEHLTPNFQPSFCKKSQLIMLNQRLANTSNTSSKTVAGAGVTDFLDRLERDVLSRKEKLAQYEQHKEVEYSFTPAINEKSVNMRPRSSYEMSRGDLLRKETNHRMNRLKYEQQVSEELTFHPEISHKASSSSSYHHPNQPSSSSSQFMIWYHEKQAKLEEKRRALAEEKENKELDECTFHPTTRDCPSYIKRIAKSMEIVRAARNASGAFMTQPVKPDWK